MAPRGRPTKTTKTLVTLSQEEMQILMTRLGYKKSQDLLDDLALGAIRPTHVASPKEVPAAEASKSRSRPGDQSAKRKSWADEVEAVDAQGQIPVEPDLSKANTPVPDVIKPDNPTAKPWADIVRGNRVSGSGLSLEFTPAGEEVVISEQKWNEGAKQWKFPVAPKVLNARPPYVEMLKWAGVNRKTNTPRVSQLKPCVFLFHFNTSEMRDDALHKNWTFFSKYNVVFKPWEIDRKLDEKYIDSTPVWVQFPSLPPRYWTPRN